MPTAERLAEFHKVENTYLSTFQTLGGLGLLLGTLGLAAVLLRNVLERRRELALLGAVGYGRSRLFASSIAESALLLVCGLAVGRRVRARRHHSRRRRARRPPADRRQWLAAALRRLRDRPHLLDRRDPRGYRIAAAGGAESGIKASHEGTETRKPRKRENAKTLLGSFVLSCFRGYSFRALVASC